MRTALLPSYASWKPDPGATYKDAVTLDWSTLEGFAFRHSVWFQQHWRRFLRRKQIWSWIQCGRHSLGGQLFWTFLSRYPVMNPISKHLLRDSASPLKIHPMYPRLHSAIFHMRLQHQAEGFSEDIARIILSATCTSTSKTYQCLCGVFVYLERSVIFLVVYHWLCWLSSEFSHCTLCWPFGIPLPQLVLTCVTTQQHFFTHAWFLTWLTFHWSPVQLTWFSQFSQKFVRNWINSTVSTLFSHEMFIFGFGKKRSHCLVCLQSTGLLLLFLSGNIVLNNHLLLI